jgi:hypothetical protein
MVNPIETPSLEHPHCNLAGREENDGDQPLLSQQPVIGRGGGGAENLNVLRKTALYILRKTSVPVKRFGISRKMLRATLSDDFLHDVLFGNSK